MSISALMSPAEVIDVPINTARLSACQYLPIPVFLLNKNLELLETNIQAEKALDDHWLRVVAGKLHFNSRANDFQVNKVVDQLQGLGNAEPSMSAYSECFVLRSIDAVCRSYTLSRESEHTSDLLLTINGDLSCSDAKVETLSRAFGLSRCESRIVNMMVNGLKPKEIAYEAGISLNTVRSHLRTLYAKMQVRDYNEALTQAVRLIV